MAFLIFLKVNGYVGDVCKVLQGPSNAVFALIEEEPLNKRMTDVGLMLCAAFGFRKCVSPILSFLNPLIALTIFHQPVGNSVVVFASNEELAHVFSAINQIVTQPFMSLVAFWPVSGLVLVHSGRRLF